MIVEPTFLDHWKTKMLIDLTSDPSSPLLMIRLWGFCQVRKRWSLEGISPEALKSITHWHGIGLDLVNHLKASGFLDDENGILKVHDWEEVNHQLITNWKNGRYGRLGGRPNSKVQKPIGLPNGIPVATHRQPIDTPIRLEKTREEKNIPSSHKLSEEEFLVNLKTNLAYKHINIDSELAKMDAWLLIHPGRQKTRKFVVNWLNKIEAPLSKSSPKVIYNNI